jgi:hypothetical protein
MRNYPDTEHEYKGFRILGRSRWTEGGYVLGGRHYKEGGPTRNYWIVKPDGYMLWPKGQVIPRLKDAKDLVDDHLKRKAEEDEKVINQG